MTEESTPVQKPECDHFAHYHQTRALPDRDTRVEADYVMTCRECGHVWTAPAPRFEVEIEFTVKAEARVDLLAYFTQLPEQGQKEYAELDLEANDYGEWERPVAFLLQNADVGSGDFGGVSVIQYRPFAERGMPQPVREMVDVEDQDLYVRVREGKTAFSWDWNIEDFEALRAAVPWLDALHLARFDDPEDLDDEELARIPGPLDTPLSFEED